MVSMTRLAQLIAKMEGFGIPGAIPTVRHNPGDLRHSPHSQHPGGPAHANDVGTIDNDADGWADLERQLRIYANEGLTLRQAIALYAPPTDHNDTSAYLNFVAGGLGVPPDTPMAQCLKIEGT
jgi:hypothetical protein